MSRLTDEMALHMRAAELPEPVLEHRFHPVRRWRFDFAWPDRKVALEVEGGVWISGRHTRAAGYINDTEKYNEAVLLGWRVIRVTAPHIDNGQALEWVGKALEQAPGQALA
jgi:very-short-patch-repair endonuclease